MCVALAKDVLKEELLQELRAALDGLNLTSKHKRENVTFGKAGTSYTVTFHNTGKTVTRHATDWSGTVFERVSDLVCSPMGSCDYVVVQRYPSGHIGIGKHKDNEMEGRTIIGLSIGATRTLVMHPPPWEAKTGQKPIAIPLPDNSVYEIRPPTNRYWMHEIPLDPNSTGVRYSLTFRNK